MSRAGGNRRTTPRFMNSAHTEPICASGCEHPRADLSTGALSATLHGDHLFDVRIHGALAVDRLYPTVRGDRWQTSTVERSRSHVRTLERGFVVDVASVHRIGGARIRCDLRILGSDDTIDVAAVFTAMTGFASRRLGLCLVLPPNLVGSPVRATTKSDVPIRTVLPRSIAPCPIVTATEVAVRIDRQSTLHVATPEDELEIEDHRNWGDPGWKIYTPALNDGAARAWSPKAVIVRRLAVRATTSAPHRPVRRSNQPIAAKLRIGAPTERRLPGLGTAVHADPARAAPQRLHHLHLRHLYLEWDPDSRALDHAANEATVLGARLVLAIVTRREGLAWPAIADRLLPHGHLLERIHVLDAETLTTTPGAPTSAREAFRRAGITVPVGGGSAVNLANVNRTRYAPGDLDYVAFGLTPQTHHRDERHILDTIHVQRDLVRQARSVAHTPDVAVMPVTWRRRADTEPDHRLQEPLAAVWLLGTLTKLIGTTNVTLLEADQLGVQPTPFTRLLATIAGHAGHPLRTTHTTHRAIVALAFDTMTLVGNASNGHRVVTLELPNVPPVQLRLGPYDIHCAPHEERHGDQ